MITFPRTLEEATAAHGEIRAGATDLFERRRLRIATGDLVDLRDLPGHDAIAWDGEHLRVGALVTVAALAEHPEVVAHFPAIAAAAGGLATPQIRAQATVGGNLLQRVRCWYFRSPDLRCLKQGGSACLARAGDHLYHACFDHGPCVAPHPSTLGLAFLAHDADVESAGHGAEPRTRSVAELYGDPGDPTREHTLEPGSILTAVKIHAPLPGERGAYFRAISRARAEWPLVEVVARVGVGDGVIHSAQVAIGGVANRPLRLPAVEAALRGQPARAEVLEAAALQAKQGAKPLPMTGYKVDLLPGAVLEALERALTPA
ncbi:MAG: FAD binding domain-containing protein [Nannocystaceae bacterium]